MKENEENLPELSEEAEDVATSRYSTVSQAKVANDNSTNSVIIKTSDLHETSLLIATTLTDNSIKIYNESLENTQTLIGHTQAVTDICFSKLQPDTLYSSSHDGTIQLWDLRLGAAVREFKDDSHTRVKRLCSFDINCNEIYMCGGSEQLIMDAFILFWDLRNVKLLGGYWDSHTDDITSVSFHDKQSNIVTTGSTDGLINVFDVSQTTEDDALQNTLNTESSVDQLRWCDRGEKIVCTTHNETLQIWDVDKVSIDKSYDRHDFVKQLKLKTFPSQLLGLNVNTNTQFPSILLSTERNDTILTEINHQPTKHAVLSNSNKLSLTGAFWSVEKKYAITADENAGLRIWKPAP